MKTKTKKVSAKIRKKKSEPLTLEAFINYTQKVLLPALDKHFTTKSDIVSLREEFNDFKNVFLANQKLMLKKSDLLLSYTKRSNRGFKKQF